MRLLDQLVGVSSSPFYLTSLGKGKSRSQGEERSNGVGEGVIGRRNGGEVIRRGRGEDWKDGRVRVKVGVMVKAEDEGAHTIEGEDGCSREVRVRVKGDV